MESQSRCDSTPESSTTLPFSLSAAVTAKLRFSNRSQSSAQNICLQLPFYYFHQCCDECCQFYAKISYMKRLLLYPITAVRLLALWVVSCTSYDSHLPYQGSTEDPDKSSAFSFLETQAYWDGDGVYGQPSIILNLTRQIIFYYKSSQLVGISPVCTGRENYATPTGTFHVIQKIRQHVSSIYGDFVDANGRVVVANVHYRDIPPNGSTFRGAPMPFFMRICGSIGIHSGVLPGTPDSHGCIRIPSKMAAIFFQHTPVGTPIRIVM